MSLTVELILVEFEWNPPAELVIIEKAEQQAGFVFPTDYRDFLLKQNDGEGWVGPNYASLWRTEELAKINEHHMITGLARRSWQLDLMEEAKHTHLTGELQNHLLC